MPGIFRIAGCAGAAMKRKAIGFYWTLPVPWAGFTDVDTRDVAKAAAQSKTIALQRAVIQAHASDCGYELVHEAAFCEIAPDRGGADITKELAKLAMRARRVQGRCRR